MKLLKTENDFTALAGRIQNTLTSIEDPEQMEKAVSFTIQSIAGRQIGMYDGLIRKKEQQLDEAVIKLKDALEKNNGSEVADQNVIRATAWVHQQEEQLDFLRAYVESDMEKAKQAYLDFFGKAWMPYSEGRNVAENARKTAANAEAKELLAKYAK